MTNTNSNVEIQFLEGQSIKDIPQIKMIRNPDRKSGKATFNFKTPTGIAQENYNNIKIMYLIDKEGKISTRDINIKLKNGKIDSIKATYRWYSELDFIRFIRFANQYAIQNDLYQEEN